MMSDRLFGAAMSLRQPLPVCLKQTRKALLPLLVLLVLLALQQGVSAQQAPDIVLTPNRGPISTQRSGSSVSVITHDEIERSGAGGILDALRAVPGLAITQNGGPGGTATIRLRGANAGQTLVLVDGVRINDPSTTAAEVDFGMISPTDIERIEILRGPQSALYGSDAMGGVISIITRRGDGKPRHSLSIGGGSYGTFETRAASSGSAGAWRYAASVTGYKTDGFSAYGNRLPRITRALSAPLEKDLAEKIGASFRLGYQPNTDFAVDASLSHHWTFLHFDNSYADDPYNKSKARITNAQVSARLATLDDTLTHRLSLFALRTERFYSFSPFFGSVGSGSDYRGDRTGAECQGTLALGKAGSLIFGTRFEQESLDQFSENLPRGSGPRSHDASEGMRTLSAFLLHQIQLGERLDLSLAGRIDAVDRSKTFTTGRATLAYRIEETGTKLRASLGTGAKAPSLYQLFSIYGTPGLGPETSIGADAGIEQSLLQGRARLSLGVFDNRFRDLIDFDSSGASCAANQIYGCYFNTSRARTRGIEASGSLVLLEDRLTLKGSYTYLDARDENTGLRLIRRAQHQGAVGFDLKVNEKLTLFPNLVLVGARLDLDFDAGYNTIRVRLAPYARLDITANYQVNDALSLYMRGENLTNARIEEVRNYGATGPAVYGGIKANW